MTRMRIAFWRMRLRGEWGGAVGTMGMGDG